MATRRSPPGGARQPGMPARSRLLGREHFAFFRGLLEGVAPERLWDRYMSVEGQRTDMRLVPATIAWIRRELAAAARREERPGTARLLRLDVQRLVASTPGLPSLAQFAEEAGLEDEREADQIEAYEAQYGRASARLRRQAKLLQRQLAALRWLEEVAARAPAPGDAVASWLRPELAAYLGAADIHTLAQLAERINGLGRGWARSIKGIGPLKAQRIAQWVSTHEDTIGVRIGSHTSLPRQRLAPQLLNQVVAAASDIRPLEKFLIPAELDGRAGRFRRPQAHCLMAADNDFDALVAWLRSKRPAAPAAQGGANGTGIAVDRFAWLAELSNTQRSYRKEAERFLLWAIVQKRKALSSITSEDCVEYAAFVADPQPRSVWCGSRSRERWSPLWRPFEGPLSPAAQRQAVTILKNLYGFLVDQAYLMGNPWSAVAKPRVAKPGLDTSRSLTAAQWRLVRDQADKAGDHSTATRLRLTLDLLYATGLRASEAVAARVQELRRVDFFDAEAGEHVGGWMLTVLGKGHKLREVPIPDALVASIEDYLAHRGLPADVSSADTQDAHLLGVATDTDARAAGLRRPSPYDPRAGITEETLYRQIKDHFKACSVRLAAAGDKASAARLAKASTHWLRHTHATHSLASGVKIQEAQQNLGHASLATTTAYVTTERAQRLKGMAMFWAVRHQVSLSDNGK
jgi:site-specific recombinase XerD